MREISVGPLASAKLWAQTSGQCGPFRQSLADARAPVKLWPSENSPEPVKFYGSPAAQAPTTPLWSSADGRGTAFEVAQFF